MPLTKERIDEIASSVASKMQAKEAEETRKGIHVEDDKGNVDARRAKVRDLKNRIMAASMPEYVREIAKVTNGMELTRNFFSALALHSRGQIEPMAKMQSELRQMVEGTPASGGYLVPEEFAQLVITKKSAIAKMRKYATVIPMNTDTLHVPYDNANASVSWGSEVGEITESNPTFAEAVLTPYKLKVMSVASNELMADANIQIINYLADQYARLMAAEEDKQFFTGNGSGRPTGVRTMTPGQTQAQAGASLAYADVLACYMNLPEQYRVNAEWFMSPTAITKVIGLLDDYGRPIFTPSFELGKPARLMGLPLLEQKDMPTNLGTHANTTEIWLGDLSTYVIGDRQDLQLAISDQRYFEFDKTAVRAISRIDGEFTLTESFSVITGVK